MQIKKMDFPAMLSAIITSSNDAIIGKDLDGIIRSWNPAAEKIFQYTVSEAIGKKTDIITPANQRTGERTILQRIKNGEIVLPYETILKRKDESTFPAFISVSPIMDENGIIVGTSKTVRDMTEQKRSENDQFTLAAIVDSSDDAIISKDLNGIINSWNKAAENIFEYTSAEAIGKHISLIIPPEKMDEESEIINSIRKGKKVNHIETVRITRSGKPVHLSITISPVKNKKGEITGASKVARDISERIKVEQKQILINRQLQELNDYKDEFMAMASHELKTPLTILQANLQILQEMLSHDHRVNFLEKSMLQVGKLNTLISDLFDVSKMQQGKLDFKKHLIDFNELLSNSVENLRTVNQSHRIVLQSAPEKVFVFADPERLEQVIINLVMNAIKYSPNSDTVWVDSVIDGNAVLVKIRDTGIGIEESELEKIFLRFYRAKGVSSTFAGTGIGLYISAEIVKKHGGKIWAENTDTGSEFYFTLPLGDDAATDIEPLP